MSNHKDDANWLIKFKNLFWDPLDPWLFYAVLTIYVMSMFLLYSADGQDIGRLENKTIHTILGVGLLLIFARIRPQILSNFALPMYVIGVVLLLGVHFFGITVNGSTRWLNLGIVRLQPSEIMKIGLPMTVAWFFQRYESNLAWFHYIAALVIIMIPGVLILKQPDLGTATLIMASGLFVMFFAGFPWKALLASIIGFCAAMPLIWTYGLHNYQKVRIMTLLDPSKDPLGAGYHILQSMIAIGSGGVWGKGWLNGTQTHLDYIPEATTDFIFAVYGEEFGLIGNILLLLVYTIILGRGLYISSKAPTLYSRTLAGALTMTFFCYVFVNMGMVSGILPVVGVPLPLVSYGGTATLSIMFIIALLMGIANQGKQKHY
ncbi:rod shape-determining protein RodA [Wielerella bovis]|uniref:rod shape-determining protein RodA n=1 Tax=Wielerella bovis TaxID=2917790 RepID=UPI00201857C7|nr:rod shape-determining protein RodA [Wielerella bovis]ULJ59633.1 rod shape-determining protein RodA [Wielerella bovis]ULJ61863.1 rod shape-determining protein RodA [Wielerella bovis]ULJ63988.1 rod shape-determining protein RodA [Wielerella bovis]ULJ68031.1 rod shape-determining protein RodA [Wielerella bovis]ULJ68636.1 rod shape-determining protein RodA [Wielerella bovis]